MVSLFWWRRVDSNHRSETQQIYSLPPLATRELLHMELVNGRSRLRVFMACSIAAAPFLAKNLSLTSFRNAKTLSGFESVSETHLIYKYEEFTFLGTCSGAGERTRTPDLLITNQLLYQLSYTSVSLTLN